MRKVIFFILISFIVINVPAKKIAEFDDLYKLIYFYVSGDDLYALDGNLVKLFSIKEQKFVAQIGKRGEGPGEYKRFPVFEVLPDQVTVRDYNKLIFFKRNGDFISEKRAPDNYHLSKVGKNFLIRESNFDIKNRTSKLTVWIGDSKLKKIKDLFSVTRDLPFSSRKSGEKMKIDREVFLSGKITVTNGNYIYIYDRSKDFKIEIYDQMGEMVRTIIKETKLVKINREFKRKYVEIEENKKTKITGGVKFEWNYIFPEYFSPIYYLSVEKEKIYITTLFNDAEKKKISILDIKGNLLKHATVSSLNKSTIHNNKYYYFIDNEDEEVWELHVKDL